MASRSRVCVLTDRQASKLEFGGELPDCQFHDHMSHTEADELIMFEANVEGLGKARSVSGSTDGRRRIALIKQIELGRVSSPMKQPPKHHYPIPALGDHRLAWHYSFMITETRKVECF